MLTPATLTIVLSLATALLVPSSPAPAQQRPTFGATIARVRVDVIVTDTQGRFVDNLRPEDFVLYEDEVEQRVLGVQVVDLAAGLVTQIPPGMSSGSRLPGAASGPAYRDKRPIPSGMASDFGALVFFVDLPGLDRENKDRFAAAWQEFLESTELLGVPRAVYMIDQVGRLKELAPLTTSVNQLRDAVAAVREAPLVRRGVHDRLVRVAADLMAQELLDFFDPEADDLNEIRALEAQERARTRSTLELLTRFCNALAVRGGRTALVWVTSEVQLTESGPGTALAAAYSEDRLDEGGTDRSRRTGSTQFSYHALDAEISNLQKNLHRAANSANVSIYTIDPREKSDYRSLPVDMRVRGPELGELLNSSIVQDSLDGLSDALWQAADETGGRAFIGPSELQQALHAIDRDTSEFYLLSYAPPPPHGDGEFHTIRVEVNRPNVNVRQRTGYVDFSPAERETRTLDAALAVPGSVTELPVSASTIRGWSDSGDATVQLIVAVEQGIRQQARPPVASAHELHALAVDTDGRIIDEFHQEMRASGPAPRTVLSGERPTVYVREWPLPPGDYDLRIAVRDLDSGEIGATHREVSVPDNEEGWHTSDLMLAVADDDLRPVPLVNGWVLTTESLFTFVEVRGGGEPVLRGHFLDAEGSTPVFDLPEVPLSRVASGVHRGAHRITNLPPGDFILEVTVTDPAANGQRSFRVPIQVIVPVSERTARR